MLFELSAASIFAKCTLLYIKKVKYNVNACFRLAVEGLLKTQLGTAASDYGSIFNKATNKTVQFVILIMAEAQLAVPPEAKGSSSIFAPGHYKSK